MSDMDYEFDDYQEDNFDDFDDFPDDDFPDDDFPDDDFPDDDFPDDDFPDNDDFPDDGDEDENEEWDDIDFSGMDNQEDIFYLSLDRYQDQEIETAANGFKRILEIEEENEEKGEWGFKALGYLVIIEFKQENYKEACVRHEILLNYVVDSLVSTNDSKSVLDEIFNEVGSGNDQQVKIFSDLTLNTLKQAGKQKFWFEVSFKLAKILFKNKKYSQVIKAIKPLKSSCLDENEVPIPSKGNNLLEIYTLEIQIYTIYKDNKNLQDVYEKAIRMELESATIPHPQTLAIIHECGGKMHMVEKNWKEANKDFNLAFKSYDDVGSARKINCLKYMILAQILSLSNVDPFADHACAAHKNNPQIVAFNDLLRAYESNDIQKFETILEANRLTIMNDEFIISYIDHLMYNIRTEVLKHLVTPYTVVHIPWISKQLNIPEKDVETLLVSLILDDQIKGKIDQIKKLLVLQNNNIISDDDKYNALNKWNQQITSLHGTVINKLRS
eukprot:TRINITY_DN2167_c0_g2_i1.p1 TRINITY_DN2167_c0_g2~~TRINITY_DN2167_c0_g2_i1.p1  ORF type:complete len:498 (+),score=189.10 TRINITY_DN2167_c0_g2_i1:173-1666(+)